ncbi:MAG: hypothetical protein ACYTGP_04125 [Planctomycetota bacterium]|jgi:hypothetical protein
MESTSTGGKSRVVVVLGGVVVVILILVALAPTLIGATMGRSLVTGAVAEQLNGTPSVGAVSLSWFGTQRVSALKVTEAGGREALDLDVTVHKGLLGLLGGVDGATIDVSGTVNGAVNADGTTSFETLKRETPASASSGGGGSPSLTVNVDDLLVALELPDRRAGTFVLDDLAGTVTLASSGAIGLNVESATTAGSTSGSVDVDMTIDGDEINGTVKLVRLPSSVAAIAVKHDDVDLGRDLGPIVDVTAHVKPASGGMDLDVTVTGSKLRLEAKAVVDTATGAVEARSVDLAAEVQPALFEALTDGSTIDRPTPVIVNLTSLSLPPAPKGEDEKYPIHRVGVTGSVTVMEPVVVTVASDNPIRSAVERARVGIASARLGDEATIDLDVASGLAEGQVGRLAGNLVVHSPFNDAGEVTIGPNSITGELNGTDVPTGIAQLLPTKLPIDFPRDVGPTIDISARFDADEVLVTLDSQHVGVTAFGVVDASGAFAGRDIEATLDVHPALAADLGIEIDAPARVYALIESLAVPAPPDDGYTLSDLAIDGIVTVSGPSNVAVGETVIDMTRDLGGSVELATTLAPGGDLEVRLTAGQVRGTVTGRVGDGGALSGSSSLTGMIQPALFQTLTGVSVESPVRAEATVSAFSWPATGDLRYATIDADLAVGNLAVTAGGARYASDGVALAVSSDGIGGGVSVTGSAGIESGRVEFEQSISGLFDDDGNFDSTGITPVGTIDATGLTGAQLIALLPEEQRTAVNRAVLYGDVGASIRTSRAGDGFEADVSLQAGHADVTGSVRRTTRGLRVQRGRVKLVVTSALLAALQEESEDPVRLEAPANAIVTLEDFELPVTDDGYGMPAAPIAFDLNVVGGALIGGTIKQAVALGGLNASGTARLGDAKRFTLAGTAQLDRAGAGARLFDAEYDVSVDVPEQGSAVPGGRVRLTQLGVTDLESVLGLEPETMSGTVGQGGAVEIAIATTGAQTRRARRRGTTR